MFPPNHQPVFKQHLAPTVRSTTDRKGNIKVKYFYINLYFIFVRIVLIVIKEVGLLKSLKLVVLAVGVSLVPATGCPRLLFFAFHLPNN
jgi:hypothetical protein